MSIPATRRSRVYMDRYEVVARLNKEGVVRDWLEDAARQGDLQRKLTSPLELPGAPAYKAVSRGLEVLRTRALDADWHPHDYLGIPVTFNPTRTTAIAVTEGDEYTGLLGDRDPMTRALKGPNTRRATERNEGRLFDDAPVSFWYLLTYSDDGGLRAELSSPALEQDGRVRGWDERILLGTIKPIDGLDVMPRPAAPVAPATAPDVQVRRRTA